MGSEGREKPRVDDDVEGEGERDDLMSGFADGELLMLLSLLRGSMRAELSS
jgi:hypothetical protein